MQCRKPDHYVTGIVISVWTVVQTGFHILWVLSGYFFYKCELKPSYYWLVMMYLTYFYNSECGKPVVQDDGIFKYHLLAGKNETDLFEVAKEIVENAEFPPEARQARRTFYYLVAFLLADLVWIFTALLLFIGTCCRLKKRISLVFYIPWLWMTGAICIMDVVAAVHFGVDLLQINDYTSLLRFIGIVNYENFSHLNSLNNSSYVPAEFTTVLCILFARFLVFWVSNIVLFSRVMNTAIWAYAGVVDPLECQEKVRRRKVVDSVLNLDTSESRIRTWQMFYGAIDNTSTLTRDVSRTDCNSNDTQRKIRIDPIPKNIDDPSSPSVCTAQVHKDLSYRRFSDVSLPCPHRGEKLRKNSVDSLKGQFPWSYIEQQKNNVFELQDCPLPSKFNDQENSTRI